LNICYHYIKLVYIYSPVENSGKGSKTDKKPISTEV